jgi:3-hydroxyacyl-CoA dehydrogenase/enoyl-CoA hydratase/3-hydroxybutyryl-CoA epimerase
MNVLNLKIDKKIAILEIDQPNSKVNVLNTETMRELEQILDELSYKAQSEVKALIIASKKEGVFIAGADIKEIERINSKEEAKEKAEKGKQILNKLHQLDLISVAMINGVCLGGGLELALACKYRLASFSDKVKIGLPEVKLGLLPGWSGTQRLPRLIGLLPALNMIVTGQIISGKEALKYGLVDRLFSEVTLLSETINFVQELLEKKIQIKRKPKKKLLPRFLESTTFGRLILFHQVKKNVLKKSKGFYPAPLKIVELIKCTFGRDIQKGCHLESEAFSELAVTEVAKNLIKVFYLNEEFKKYPWVDNKNEPVFVNKCGIVGAGVMGGGIAQLVSYNDIPVRIKDINYKALKKALQTASSLFEYARKKKKLKDHQIEYKLGLISPTLTYSGFANADIVIEAVVEDLKIKQEVFNRLDSISSKKTILASNTSSLPIIKMAEATNCPERVVGLHFFNPVHRMPLVEVIKSVKTSDQALASVIAFARRIGKIVIVVKDATGFLINRILLSYLIEAGFLLEEGMKIERIDRIASSFGMPMGPLELIDEIGIDVGYKVVKILEDAYGERMRPSPILEKVKQKGLLGKKTKRGFYLHKKKKRKLPNPEVYRLIQPTAQRLISDELALKRMIYTMINEATRCLEEKVVDRPQTVDIGMIMGTGFAPFRAGLLRYADSVGIDKIVKELQSLAEQFQAVRFKPCNFLLEKAEKKEKIYN